MLIIASHNRGKIAEFTELLASLGITASPAASHKLPDVVETGTTFAENALLKANSALKHTGLPALADDSGLCVEALDGRPGVYSARYGTYRDLLSEMVDVPLNKRSAAFHCVLALALPGQQPVLFTGITEGYIAPAAKGNSGFGYDPVFIPKGDTRTYGEMTAHEKAKTSHRAHALKQLIDYIRNNPGLIA